MPTKLFTLAMSVLVLTLWAGHSFAEQVDTGDKAELQLAVAPFLPAHLIIKNYQPMREYLEQQLQQPVSFITAPDYAMFYERTQRREYAVIITVAHAAYLAHTEAGYVPMLRPVNLTHPILVVPARSNIKDPVELKNKTIGMPEQLAIISMQGIELLHEAGLNPETEIRVKHLPNHSAAVNHVISGDVAAAIVSNRALMQMPAKTRQQVKIIHQRPYGAAPGVIYLASPVLPPERIALLSQTIQTFVEETPSGVEFIRKLGYGNLVPATGHDLEPIAKYGVMFKSVLKQQQE